MLELNKAVQILRQSRRVLCITGAGISADSGLPTYRGIGGLYNDQTTEDGIPIEMALAGEMLQQRPDITWRYLSQIEQACRGASYNEAHKALVELENHAEVCILTQNIDGFHRAAGSHNVIEIHGCMDTLECMRCGQQSSHPDYAGLILPPTCPHCGGIQRPNVVLFGEMLPARALARYYAEIQQGFDVVISIGTTSVFPYIAGPVIEASQSGIPTIEINPGDTEVSSLVDIRLRVRAASALTRLLAMLKA